MRHENQNLLHEFTSYRPVFKHFSFFFRVPHDSRDMGGSFSNLASGGPVKDAFLNFTLDYPSIQYLTAFGAITKNSPVTG